MFVDRVIEGEKKPFLRAILRSYTAIASLSLEAHSPASLIAQIICALVDVGVMTFTSFEAKVRSESRLYNYQIKSSTIIYKFFEKVHSETNKMFCLLLPYRRLGKDNPVFEMLEKGRFKDGRIRFPIKTRVEVYRNLIDTIRKLRPKLQIGLCMEGADTFKVLNLENTIGFCNCAL
jgi:hypothetical protein